MDEISGLAACACAGTVWILSIVEEGALLVALAQGHLFVGEARSVLVGTAVARRIACDVVARARDEAEDLLPEDVGEAFGFRARERADADRGCTTVPGGALLVAQTEVVFFVVGTWVAVIGVLSRGQRAAGLRGDRSLAASQLVDAADLIDWWRFGTRSGLSDCGSLRRKALLVLECTC